MKKQLSILFFIIPLFIFGESINKEKATLVAKNFILTQSNTYSEVQFSESIKNSANETLFYVFKLLPEGFILVSADDRSEPVLAYSFKNNFSYNKLSDWQNEWLEQYKTQINFIINNSGDISTYRKKWNLLLNGKNQREDIITVGPLITAKWHQGDPYNLSCPYDTDANGNYHVPAGCVAIAMAEILYYYEFPNTGKGYFSYNPSYNGNEYGELSADFENTNYDSEQILI